MAKIPGIEIDEVNFTEWLAERPEVVKQLAAQFRPDRLYLLKTTGHRVTIAGYNEGNTLIVNVTGEFNKIMFDRQVFGIPPEDLEECDLPAEDEELGTQLTEQKDIEAFINQVRMAEAAADGDLNRGV